MGYTKQSKFSLNRKIKELFHKNKKGKGGTVKKNQEHKIK